MLHCCLAKYRDESARLLPLKLPTFNRIPNGFLSLVSDAIYVAESTVMVLEVV